MKIDCEAFRVAEGAEVGLVTRPTTVKLPYKSGKHYRKLIEEKIAELTVQQSLLYAINSHCLLLIFQAMDAAGKDSTIKHVMSDVKDRVVMLPQSLVGGLKGQLNAARSLWTLDQEASRGGVFMPDTLERKYPRAGSS